MKEIIFLNSNDIDLIRNYFENKKGDYYSTSGINALFESGANQVMELFFRGHFLAFGRMNEDELIDLIIINNSEMQNENRKYILVELISYSNDFLNEVFEEIKELLELNQLIKYKIGLSEISEKNLSMLNKIGFNEEFNIFTNSGKKYVELGKIQNEKSIN